VTLQILLGLALFAVAEGILLSARPVAYMTFAFPLPVEPLPLQRLPEGEGRTATVRWDVQGDLARYVAHGGGLPGLHGAVRFVRDRPGIRLDVSWAPPVTLLALCAAIGFLGAEAGVPWVSVPLSIALFVACLAAYQQAAVRAAVELRFAWAQSKP
jgi:hypothetical protein